MPPRKSKKNVWQTSQVDPPVLATLTLEQISAAFAQLLEGQRKTQEQVKVLLAQQSNPQPEGSQSRSADGD